MKHYNDKNTRKIYQKHEEKTWKRQSELDGDFVTYYETETWISSDMWSNSPFLIRRKSKQKPFMNLYKEIIKLNYLCKVNVVDS